MREENDSMGKMKVPDDAYMSFNAKSSFKFSNFT